MAKSEDVPHPGTRIRVEVIPQGMSVTKAAQLIGVGRPALSNLLNGKASLSSDMARRLEKAFKFSHKELLDMQAQYDAAQAKRKSSPANAKAYVPPFLAIKANDIEQWVSRNIQARSRLSVFLRTLVNSTGTGLTKVDFPGNDDAERPGWDGVLEATDATPWIPSGRSGWEYGTNEDIPTKATGDFNKSVKAINKNERADTTFVFVTPRHWPGKDAWVKKNQEKGLWKDVRAYDSSDLEQWLEQSLPAQTWLANEIGFPTQRVRSLDKCWDDWANVSTPPLTGNLFSSAIDAAKRIMLSRLNEPSDGPTIIVADSTEEALAFVSQLFSEFGGDELPSYRDQVIVFDKPDIFPRLAEAAQTFIPVALTRDVERELAPYAKSMHSIVIYPRNAVIAEPHIILEPVPFKAFEDALAEMGKNRDEISKLTNASGRSLTVLRRQLAAVQAIRIPQWAENHQTAAKLVPFLFVGSWNNTNDSDRVGLSLLAGDRPYAELEKDFQSLAQLNDTPIWSIGDYRGVISKIDLLYAIGGAVTSDDLKQYFGLARIVLGEDDPALDLAEDQRWAASVHGQIREFSGAFRKGISETLVLLAVHGGKIFKKSLGVDTEIEAAKVVSDLLPEPLITRVLEANDHDLPTYAEAAPDTFLKILERDLETDEPAVLGLLLPVDTSKLWHHSSRTGLLWALEGLAWNPETLPRVVSILARLAQIEIDDNLMNKPIHSLGSIFRAWMPQTAADIQTRVTLIKNLKKKFPDIAWILCVAQFGRYQELGNYNHKPSWRSDGYGFGEPYTTREPIVKFAREMVEMALAWDSYSLTMLIDLVERVKDLLDADQERVWSLMENWAKTKASDEEKAILREKIRVSVLSRRAVRRARKTAQLSQNIMVAAKTAYAALEPSDILNKYSWLFRNSWVDESADEIDDIDSIDYAERDKRIRNLRVDALCEIYKKCGVAALLKLAKRGNTPWVIGGLSASFVLTKGEIQQLLKFALESMPDGQEDTYLYRNFISGVLGGVEEDDKRAAIIQATVASLSDSVRTRLLVLAPYRKATWALVDSLDEESQGKYWEEVVPDWIHISDEENIESVERLMKADRPRAAFSCVKYAPEKLGTTLLYRLLSEMAEGRNDKHDQYKLEYYHVEKAFEYLNNSAALTLEQMAGLEFAYMEVLARSWDMKGGYGVPNLERYIEAHPEMYVQAIVWTFKRKDGAADPDDFRVSPDNIETMAERGYKLLDAIQRIPGHNGSGQLETERLEKWITTVRQSCSELGRIESADVSIGEMLSHAPIGKDNIWPCEQVREVMEDIQSEDIMRGVCVGVYNSRGVHWRGDGGDQERELAEKYRKWGLALQSSHPYVASRLLMEMANRYDHEAMREDTRAGLSRRMH